MGLLNLLKEQKDAALNDYQGLLSAYPNANKFFSGLVQNLAAVAPPDPRDAQASQAYAINRAFDIPGGFGGAIDVWHGSPHKFDAFDMSKIGTGEGAQAYGHGLYFAESPDVARGYQDKLSAAQVIDDQTVDEGIKNAKRMMTMWGDGDQAKSYMQRVYGYDENQAETLMQKARENHAGNLYKTSLQWPDASREATDPLGPQHFLDWDKPLSEQPEIAKLLGDDGINSLSKGYETYKLIEQLARESKPDKDLKSFQSRNEAVDFFNKSLQSWKKTGLGDTFKPTAKTIDKLYAVEYPVLSKYNKSGSGPVEDASAYLKELGIPGIRYLDGGSRGAGEGSYNYVVFDDQVPKILERNGKGLLKSFTK
ncbi:MAG: hypothetical protein RL563_1088 [Pseudomonadota bacterium]|jgi:hypothetical protein